MTGDLPHTLPRIARDAIAAHLEGRAYEPAPRPPALDRPAGVFVTLHAGSALRGCIGHIAPTTARLADEVAVCARLAAFSDPRFPPVRSDELPELTVEVSVLQPPTPVTDRGSLDPNKYGVIVTCGSRRGLLLPEIPGVDTVDEQLAIALRKAGIRPTEPWTLERFEVQKHQEVIDP